jgi:hypothetical protein
MELPLVDRVTLTQVPESQRHITTNLMQLYKYDFSEFAEVGSRYGEVGPDGRFTYEGLDSYWREDGLVPLTVEADGRLAGFVLVNRWSANPQTHCGHNGSNVGWGAVALASRYMGLGRGLGTFGINDGLLKERGTLVSN